MRQGGKRLRSAVERAIEEYNKYRSPEATARLVRLGNGEAVIVFEGSFCETCGVNEWIIDMEYVMKDLGIDAELVGIDEPEDINVNRRVGRFRIRRISLPPNLQ